MDKKILAAAIGMAVLAVTYATAAPSLNTPLYTYRMEQSSSKMHFLPTDINCYTYTAEKGYHIHDNICDIANKGGGIDSVINTCNGTGYTCNGEPTCHSSCPDTCRETCPGWFTCWETCYEPTCETCSITCDPGCLTAATETC